jgi:trimeric autotransporter adhesin
MSNFVNLMDLVYPVGAIYQSTSSTSPAEMFGGTWVQVTGKFLKASNDSLYEGGV